MKIKFLIFDFDEKIFLADKIEVVEAPITHILAYNNKEKKEYWPHEIRFINCNIIENYENKEK